MDASAPLRRLHREAAAAASSSQITVRTRDVAEANEAWVLPTAAALLATAAPDSSSSSSLLSDLAAASSRDAFGRTVLHLAALSGLPRFVAMLRAHGSEARSDERREQQRSQGAAEQCGTASVDAVSLCLSLSLSVSVSLWLSCTVFRMLGNDSLCAPTSFVLEFSLIEVSFFCFAGAGESTAKYLLRPIYMEYLYVEFVCKCIYVYFTYILDEAGTSHRT
eukprot:COSAG03_NODE_825_length_5714_cov_3.543900_3_plen_221_part_00